MAVGKRNSTIFTVVVASLAAPILLQIFSVAFGCGHSLLNWHGVPLWIHFWAFHYQPSPRRHHAGGGDCEPRAVHGTHEAMSVRVTSTHSPFHSLAHLKAS
ncbi:hypothetical protein BDZ88DRAFT_62550 [Geranomyces variabilis]|nr:hypothetical protein BDZ88DRAFT_62550 [Geranomyces variabilis]